MRMLTLNDGSKRQINRCAPSRSGHLWILITDIATLLEAATIFSNQDLTRHMVDQREEEGAIRYEYDGYTQLIELSLQEDGVLIALRKVESE